MIFLLGYVSPLIFGLWELSTFVLHALIIESPPYSTRMFLNEAPKNFNYITEFVMLILCF